MPRAALFDVDGTLVDTNHLHVVTWWEALRQAGRHVPMADIHRAIGLGSEDLLAHLLGDDRDSDRDPAISAAHKTLYATYFDRLRAFEGAADLLRALAAQQWRVVLATSAGGAELAAMRRAIGADDALMAEARADEVDAGKPAPDPVEEALRRAGVGAGDAVFVGDSVWDMEAGTKAGVRAVGVLSGGVPRTALEAAGADAVYTSVEELLAELDASPFGDV
ncbi:HAD family hydrolase [Streptomyces montanisoli]|uniref:HAD family hydrolase n=1 Tax=Streptomyces montanisoli TaxID=2798581 RepID=A0A940MBU8_9ACTN|nr:HAD family hydrolase [Streptomyces montanisoli]MBP0457556.1 HAD family hydrolase [Streptomyces montanisoli]